MNCGTALALRAIPWIALALCTGCVSPKEETFAPDSPVYLREAAAELRGAKVDDLSIFADTTIADIPLRTSVIRKVARGSEMAVVSLFVKVSNPYTVSLLPIRVLGINVDLPGEALGSGFFIHPSGYLLTNDHVVRHADEIKARTATGDELSVIVVARDPVLDLALCRVKYQDGTRRFPALRMGDSEIIDVGEPVIAVGNPLGLGHTVTQGIISQTGRNLYGVKKEEGRFIEYLQTDTAINPGSSGGPLITMTGAWIGVNTAGLQGAQGINFAVPSHQVKEFLQVVFDGKGELEKR